VRQELRLHELAVWDLRIGPLDHPVHPLLDLPNRTASGFRAFADVPVQVALRRCRLIETVPLNVGNGDQVGVGRARQKSQVRTSNELGDHDELLAI
jgi:hypothetical protein